MDNERPGCLKIRMHRPEKTDNNNTVENPFGPLSFVYGRQVQKEKNHRKRKKKNLVKDIETYTYTARTHNLVYVQRTSNWLGKSFSSLLYNTAECFSFHCRASIQFFIPVFFFLPVYIYINIYLDKLCIVFLHNH